MIYIVAHGSIFHPIFTLKIEVFTLGEYHTFEACYKNACKLALLNDLPLDSIDVLLSDINSSIPDRMIKRERKITEKKITKNYLD